MKHFVQYIVALIFVIIFALNTAPLYADSTGSQANDYDSNNIIGYDKEQNEKSESEEYNIKDGYKAKTQVYLSCNSVPATIISDIDKDENIEIVNTGTGVDFILCIGTMSGSILTIKYLTKKLSV